MNIPTVMQAKQQARQLRDEFNAQGNSIFYSEALEKIAVRYGYRDWNGLKAAMDEFQPENWPKGAEVIGRYLGHSFEAKVVHAIKIRLGWFRLVLDLNEAIDVVPFAGFTNIRKRIRGNVGPLGYSKEQTSDGRPHLIIEL